MGASVPRNDSLQRLRAVANRQHGIVSRAQILESGVSRRVIDRRIASGEWDRVLPSTYKVRHDADRWRQRLWGAALWLGPRAVVSHRAALALHRLGPAQGAPLEFSLPHAQHVKDTRGCILHRCHVEDSDMIKIEGLRVTNLTKTLIDAAAVVDQRTIGSLLDTAVCKRNFDLHRLVEWLDNRANHGRDGVGAMRAALERWGVGSPATESHLERDFLRFLRSYGFVEPQKQVWIREGEFAARVDFAYPDLNLVIEVDGFEHHGGRGPFDKDHERSNEIVALGHQVLHVTKAHMTNEKRLVAQLDALKVPRQMDLAH